MSLWIALVGLAFAEEATLLEAADLLRWPDVPDVTTVSVAEGAQVEVVYRAEGEEMVRVMSGENDFGWVKVSALAIIEDAEDAEGAEDAEDAEGAEGAE